MLLLSTVRNTIFRALKAETGVAFIKAEQNGAKKPDYPFGAGKFTTPGRMINPQATYFQNGQQATTQTVESVLSITCYSDNEDVATNIAFEAAQCLQHYTPESITLANIVVVDVSSITNRTTFLTDGYEYAIGFDVRLRMTATHAKDVEVIEHVSVTLED